MHDDLIGALNKELSRRERAIFEEITRPRKPIAEESKEDYKKRMSVKNTTRPLERPGMMHTKQGGYYPPGYRPGYTEKND